MTDDRAARHANDANGDDFQRNSVKDPDDWKTGDEPMTGPQQSYLNTLAQEAGADVNPNLTKADASKKIDELHEKTGRGQADENR